MVTFFKNEKRELPAREVESYQVSVCPVEGCEKEFSDEEDAREHYLRKHLKMRTKKNETGKFLHFENEETFKLFTEFPYKDQYPWSPSKWKGTGWYYLEYGWKSRGCSCGCSDEYARLTWASTWLSGRIWEIEGKIKKEQVLLQKYEEFKQELENSDSENECLLSDKLGTEPDRTQDVDRDPDRDQDRDPEPDQGRGQDQDRDPEPDKDPGQDQNQDPVRDPGDLKYILKPFNNY